MADFKPILAAQANVLHQAMRKLEAVTDYRNNYDLTAEEEKAVLQAQEYISSAVSLIDYFATEPKVGTLYMNARGRFEVWEEELSCGSRLEIMGTTEETAGEWFLGRVENSDEFGGYYFSHNRHSVPLQSGMIVRTRKTPRRS